MKFFEKHTNYGYGDSIEEAVSCLLTEEYCDDQVSIDMAKSPPCKHFLHYLEEREIEDLRQINSEVVTDYLNWLDENLPPQEIEFKSSIARLILQMLDPKREDMAHVYAPSSCHPPLISSSHTPRGFAFSKLAVPVFCGGTKDDYDEFRAFILLLLCRHSGLSFVEASYIDLQATLNVEGNNLDSDYWTFVVPQETSVPVRVVNQLELSRGMEEFVKARGEIQLLPLGVDRHLWHVFFTKWVDRFWKGTRPWEVRTAYAWQVYIEDQGVELCWRRSNEDVIAYLDMMGKLELNPVGHRS